MIDQKQEEKQTCRPSMKHVKPCGETNDTFFCACGCSAIDYCGDDDPYDYVNCVSFYCPCGCVGPYGE